MKKSLIILGLVAFLSLIQNCAYSNETNLEKIRSTIEIGDLVSRNNFAAALVKCNKAMEKYPDDAELYRWRATIKSSLGEKEEAIKDFDKSLDLSPNDDAVIVMRGICKNEAGDKEGAMTDFNNAIELNPKNLSAYAMRACLKMEIGEMESANDDFEMTNKLYDESVNVETQNLKK